MKNSTWEEMRKVIRKARAANDLMGAYKRVEAAGVVLGDPFILTDERTEMLAKAATLTGIDIGGLTTDEAVEKVSRLAAEICRETTEKPYRFR